MIKWKNLDQPDFDRIVELLLLRTNPSPRIVDVLDGRGGDGGIDVRVTSPAGKTVIYQLKFFPEGMSGGHRNRRTQVQNSFDTAVAEHTPDQWILVLPRNLTDHEQQFVRDLRKRPKPGLKKPRVSWIGQAELDDMIVDHPEVERWYLNNAIEEQLKVALIASGNLLRSGKAVTQRIAQMSNGIDAIDPHWTFDYRRDGDTIVNTLRPQHDHADKVAPIRLSFEAALGCEPGLRKKFRRVLDYGGPSEITIPGKYLSTFSITGSPLVETTTPPDELTIGALPLDAPLDGKLVVFEFFDSEGAPVASFDATVTRLFRGALGVTLSMSLYDGHITVTLPLPFNQVAGESQDLDLAYRLGGLRPAEAGEVLEFARLIRLSPRVHISLDGQSLTKIGRADPTDNALTDEEILLAGLASDLDIIDRHFGLRRQFPAQFSLDDCVGARVTRRLIEGYLVASPVLRSLTGTLVPSETTGNTRRILEGIVPTRFMMEGHDVTFAGRSIDIGRVVVTHPRTRAVNGDDALRHLDAGKTDEFQVIFKPEADPYFYVYIPDIDRPSEEQLEYVSWNLPGIDEPWLTQPWLSRHRAIGQSQPDE